MPYIEIEHKYNIDDRVFVYSNGYIIYAKINKIAIVISDSTTCTIKYLLKGDNDFANEKLETSYKEEQLSPTLEDIVNHMEVL